MRLRTTRSGGIRLSQSRQAALPDGQPPDLVHSLGPPAIARLRPAATTDLRVQRDVRIGTLAAEPDLSYCLPRAAPDRTMSRSRLTGLVSCG